MAREDSDVSLRAAFHSPCYAVARDLIVPLRFKRDYRSGT
jgi:hypothetical protein